jgi:hypothetical protein
MESSLPLSTVAHTSVARLRRYAVLALCVASLTFTVASTSAHVNTRIKTQTRGSGIAPRGRPSNGYTRGVPTMGERGVELPTADIMQSQFYEPSVERLPRLMFEPRLPGRNALSQGAARFVGGTPSTAAFSLRGGLSRTSTAPASHAPQTIGLNFTAATLGDTGAIPPDSMGAVGPVQFVVFVNGLIRTFDKSSGEPDGVLNVDTNIFFSSVMTPQTPSGNNDFINLSVHPQVRFDRLSGRWFLTAVDEPGTSPTTIGDTPNRLLIAVSDAASGGVISNSTVWTFYFVQQNTVGGDDTGESLDQPSLGIDANALYVGGNMLNPSTHNFNNAAAFVIRKSSILSGGPVVATAFRNLITAPGPDGMLTPRGVDNYDPSATEGYFIGVSAQAFDRLNMRRIATSGGTPSISADIPFSVNTTSDTIPVAHLGNTGGDSGRLSALDDRLLAAYIRNGRLWTAHTIGTVGNGVAGGTVNGTPKTKRDSVRWYELIVPAGSGTPTVNQSGTIFDTALDVTNARQFFIPTVMVSGQGHAALGFSTAGTTFRADAATSGRLRTDTLGTTQAVNVYTSSSTAYNPPTDPGGATGRRWGSYSFTSLDPKDDMTIWTIQEFCDATDSYEVRVAKLNAPPPATPSAVSQHSIPAGQPSVNVNVTGTSAGGSEFYDPAVPFNHITATVSGGVTVNSVTYVDPTHVTLNLNTTAATVGAKNITVTNPDGQSTTASNVLFVGSSPILITEFRFHGPSGGNDEFIELYNNTDAPITVADTNGGAGYSVVGTNTTGSISNRCTVSNGTIIPARGHFLCTNSAASGYSLGVYATGNVPYGTGIVDGGGVAVFSTTTLGSWSANTLFDAVGFQGITGTTLFTEGAALAPAGGISASGEYSFVRKMRTATGGLPQDTNNNQNDFVFVSTDGGTYSTRVSTLGAPGPENLSSPVERNSSFGSGLLDTTKGASNSPNRDRGFTSNQPNAPDGTLIIRRTFTNDTGQTVTRLRFRIIDMTTFNSPARSASQAQLRAVNSGSSVVTVNGNPLTVEGTTIETPPTQGSGGGINTSLGRSLVSGTIINTAIPASPAPGSTVNVQFTLGIVQGGTFRFYINVEALP